MTHNRRLKVISLASISALLLCLAALAGSLRLLAAKQATDPLTYYGVNHMGSEYRCIGTEMTNFDGPVDQVAINAMLSWKISIVRIPLNEDCWLGLNGEPANGTSAAQYRSDISNYVHLLSHNGLKVIVEMHWSAPGSQQATGQQPMPDADHAPSFWTSVANTFKSNSGVFFDLYNEPSTTSWLCWRNGSSHANANPCSDVGFAVAGMQTLVDTVRNTGATNLILLGGLNYANNLSGWLQNKPVDPLNNLAASLHIYNFSNCNTISCLNVQVAPVRAHYPVLAEEIGENDCGHTFIDSIMPWLDSHSIGYLGWTWNTYNCSSSPALISDYNGTPTDYGIGLKNHLALLALLAHRNNHRSDTTYYEIVNRNSGLVLTINNGSTSNGDIATQQPYHAGTNQQWQKGVVNGGSLLINRNSEKVFDDPGGLTTSGTQLDQWDSTNSSNQWWNLIAAGNGYYYIVNQSNHLYVDVSGASTANGTAVIEWPGPAGTNQQWQFVQV